MSGIMHSGSLTDSLTPQPGDRALSASAAAAENGTFETLLPDCE